MLSFPNAKINIGLSVIERRPDAFHNIETIYYPVALSDILEIIPLKENHLSKVKFHSTGMPIPGDINNNLCIKAYQLLDNDFDLPPVKIVLHKLIPMGAGLGGGSSDAASALMTLNNLFDLHIDVSVLQAYASKIGSDCSFFINNKPALGTGKGDILEPITVILKGYYLVLVKPSTFVGTAEAYAGITPAKPMASLKDKIQRPVAAWKECITNDFEQSIFKKYPDIGGIKEQLYNLGATYAALTGSGAAVYGIFNEEVNLRESFPGQFYWSAWL